MVPKRGVGHRKQRGTGRHPQECLIVSSSTHNMPAAPRKGDERCRRNANLKPHACPFHDLPKPRTPGGTVQVRRSAGCRLDIHGGARFARPTLHGLLQPLAQFSHRGCGIGRRGDGGANSHAIDACRQDLADVGRIDPANRKGRQTNLRRRGPQESRARETPRTASFPTERSGRRRCSSPRRAPPAAPARSNAWKRRQARLDRRSCRASFTERSSWPTWTPSARASAAMSARSLTINSVGPPAVASRNARARWISSRSPSVLSRSWMASAPAATSNLASDFSSSADARPSKRT